MSGGERTAWWVYRDLRVTAGCYTVGFYAPDGGWHAESDHDTRADAAERVRYLNGGAAEVDALRAENEALRKERDEYRAEIAKAQRSLQDAHGEIDYTLGLLSRHRGES